MMGWDECAVCALYFSALFFFIIIISQLLNVLEIRNGSVNHGSSRSCILQDKYSSLACGSIDSRGSIKYLYEYLFMVCIIVL